MIFGKKLFILSRLWENSIGNSILRGRDSLFINTNFIIFTTKSIYSIILCKNIKHFLFDVFQRIEYQVLLQI